MWNIITKLVILWTEQRVPLVCVRARTWILSKGRGVRLFQTSWRHKKLDSWSTTTSSLSHFECKIPETGDASLLFSSVRSAVRKHIIVSSFKNVLSFVSYFIFPALLIHSFIHSFIPTSFLSFILAVFPSFFPCLPSSRYFISLTSLSFSYAHFSFCSLPHIIMS